MPKRRLHGETQKRRKKRSTQLLKRQDTIVRVRSTLKPAPFERSTQPEREDLEFQEAMREMDVRRSPWSGESSERRKKVESVRFLAGVEEEGQFREKMAELGVQPLGKAGKSRAGSRIGSPVAPPGDAAGAASVAAPRPGEHQEAGNTGSVLPEKTGEELPLATGETPETQKPEGMNPVARGDRRQPAGSSGKSSITTFQMEEEGEDLAALLEEIPFDPEMKFEGSRPPSPDHRASRAHSGRGNSYRRALHPEAMPDSELDLHGKTLEEAIAMVQNFLLVSHEQRLRSVLIITGKGRNSGEGGPVLQQAVYRWLERNGSRFARDFHHAPARLGGEGAIWVTLR